MVMHQKYVHEADHPLEIQFMMLLSESFTCQKIAVNFTMPDGSTESFETRVVERVRAEQRYDDAVASGQTTVLATLPPIKTNKSNAMVRINLGGMPDLATANLRAFCSQKLEARVGGYESLHSPAYGLRARLHGECEQPVEPSGGRRPSISRGS